MTRPTALVTGVTGQDGVHLARLLLAEGLRVVGTVRPGTLAGDPLTVYLDGVTLVEHDVRDAVGFGRLLAEHEPAEVYNLASFSSVGASWGQPDLVTEVNAVAVEQMVAALLAHGAATGAAPRFFQASSADETVGLSPYARAKQRARLAVVGAREQHGLHACAALLHNHESPLRGRGFVTRKITRAAAEIRLGRIDQVRLGNLDVARDWGSAADYVRAMRLMLQRDEPVDLPLGTGVAHTLADLLATAFDAAGVDSPDRHVVQDPALVRPADADVLVADPQPAVEALGWRATTTFAEVVREMVDVDLRRVRSGIEESPDYLRPVG